MSDFPFAKITKTKVVTYRVPFADLGKLVGAPVDGKVTSGYITSPPPGFYPGQIGYPIQQADGNFKTELVVTVEEAA